MKTKLVIALVLIAVVSLFALAPGTPRPKPTEPPVVTEPPPVITEPPQKTEPPEVTEPVVTEPPEKTEIPPGPPPTEPPHIIPTERGKPHPEPLETPEGPPRAEGEPREIRLPAGGFGPAETQATSTGTIARWGLLFLLGLAGIFLAGRALR